MKERMKENNSKIKKIKVKLLAIWRSRKRNDGSLEKNWMKKEVIMKILIFRRINEREKKEIKVKKRQERWEIKENEIKPNVQDWKKRSSLNESKI